MILYEYAAIFLHLDQYLVTLTKSYGVYIYLIIFIIIFCETGLVVTPFLPGDSLLFAAGAITAATGSLNIFYLFLIIVTAAILGDSMNYSIGKRFGVMAFGDGNSQIFKKEHFIKTEVFYTKYGNKAVLLGRFFPIIRTFVPFVAGIGKMEYMKFIVYNILGALAWTTIFLFGGYEFGNIEFIKNNFTTVIFTIIILSISPGIYQIIRNRLNKKTQTI
ncbi:MAG: DedA family protein [Candidatus Vogelbacteria bacterium]|nr:DedA family protein [Candidatus Vogelbacteria bacterium]